MRRQRSQLSGNHDSRLPRGGPPRRLVLMLALSLTLAACGQEEEEASVPIRPVRSVMVERGVGGDRVTLTGDVQAQEEVALAFRVGGRMIERIPNVGDTVEAGAVVARLDPQTALNTLRSAQAALSAAEGQLAKTSNAFDRQDHLLGNGFTTRANHDAALQAMRAAQAQVDSAEAQLGIARDNVDYAELRADAAGTVTARGAEPGEVVQAGQMILRVARKDGRDAVFDVPASLLRTAGADPVVTVALTDDPSVTATGRVREVSPQADPVTRAFRVRVGLNEPPPAMRLGSTVTGTVRSEGGPTIEIPASALTSVNGRPAVWIVDPAEMTVSLRNIEVQRHNLATVTVASGLDTGETVVTAGVQALHPGQKVRLLGSGA